MAKINLDGLMKELKDQTKNYIPKENTVTQSKQIKFNYKTEKDIIKTLEELRGITGRA